MNRFGSGQRVPEVSALGSRPACGRAAGAGRPGGRAAPVAAFAAASSSSSAAAAAAWLILSMVAVLGADTARGVGGGVGVASREWLLRRWA